MPIQYSYAGWVPCIAGSLSFTRIGRQYVDARNIFIDNNHRGETHIIQIVECRTIRQDDSIFKEIKAILPSGLSPFNKKDTYYVMDASRSYDQDGKPILVGEISCWFGKIDFSNLESYRSKNPTLEKFTSKLRGATYLHSVDFKLRICGECFFGNFSQSENLTYVGSQDIFERDIISQAYMFLRDMAHRHKHHHYSEDTFIDVKRNSVGWHRKVSFDLARQAIKKPLSNVPTSYDDAIGILAYLRSFQNSYRIELPEEEAYSLESIDAWERSLVSEGQKSSKKYSLKLYWGGLILGILYLLTGLLINLDNGISLEEFLILLVAIVITILVAQTARLRPRERKYIQFELAKIYTRGNLNYLFAAAYTLISIGLAYIASRLLLS